MVTRRFSSFFLVGVIIASTIFPASAWGKDSFISGGQEYESSVDVSLSDDLPAPDVYAAPYRAPRMFKASSADLASVEANTTGKLVVPSTLPSSVGGSDWQVRSKYYFKSYTPPVKVKFDYWRDVVATFSVSPVLGSNYLHLLYNTLSYAPHVSDSDEKIRGLAAFCSSTVVPPGYGVAGSGGGNSGSTSWDFTISYDVSSYASSAFSLDGLDTYVLGCIGPYYSGSWHFVYPVSVDVLVDGQQVLTLTRGSANTIDFGGYVYSGSSNVSVIAFRWHMPFSMFISDDPAYAGTYDFVLRSDVSYNADNQLTISFLDGQDVINAQNDKTKDDINKHEELESQWIGSMTENFNKLDIGNFTFHSGLIAGFAMVSGLFMDIWHGMGDAAIAYVFPLTLGVVLVLLGRISRFGGKRGSEKGDDSS